MQGDFTT